MDAQFADPIADRNNISGKTMSQAKNSGGYQGFRSIVPKSCFPFLVGFGLEYPHHATIVIYKLQKIKVPRYFMGFLRSRNRILPAISI